MRFVRGNGKIKMASKVTEKGFQSSVLKVARLNGWLCYHPYESRRSVSGYPDLTLVRLKDRRLVYAELKVGRNKPTADQLHWLEWLNAVPCVEVYVWRPEDWGEIVKVLSRRCNGGQGSLEKGV